MIAHIRLVFWIGVGLIFLPNFGIPNALKQLLAVLVGILLAALSFGLRHQYKMLKLKLRKAEQSAQSIAESSTIIHE